VVTQCGIDANNAVEMLSSAASAAVAAAGGV
jgi:hypothetical protein